MNENLTRGRASMALSIQINVFFFFFMSVIQKLNEYTGNPCKHNDSLSQFCTGQLKLIFLSIAKHLFKHENNVQTFHVRKLFSHETLRK